MYAPPQQMHSNTAADAQQYRSRCTAIPQQMHSNTAADVKM
jgi:hypothetical protein